jgi:DNA-binding response OmpR family regulator
LRLAPVAIRPGRKMAQVLVADGSVKASVVASALRRHGFEVVVVTTAAAAVAAAPGCDLVVLGLRLPGARGLEACAAIRAVCDVPIIGTAEDAVEVDLVSGLSAGLDAFLVRPVGARELVARVDVISCGPLRLNTRTREVLRCTAPVQVTRKEFDLLRLLAADPDEVFTRRDIMSRVWGDEWAQSDRTLDTHVSSLRNKLGDPAVITTVRGVGFRIGYRPMAGTGARALTGS